MNIKQLIEQNITIWLLGTLFTGFAAGFGAYRAILEISARITIPIEEYAKYGDYMKSKDLGSANMTKSTPSLDKTHTISGTVKTMDRKPFSYATLYAAEADVSANVDENGKFLFRNMREGPYRIIVVDQSGKMLNLLIDPNDSPPESAVAGKVINWKFDKE